ncbi:MAG: DUF1559 domain-containing protein [Planctomycetaceae bacterium]
MFRSNLKRVQLLAAIIPAAVSVLVVTWKLNSLVEESRTRDCKAKFFEVAFALHKYNEKHGHLPPAVVYKDGVAMHSWRVLILEFTAPDLFSQYRMSEPWNSPHNSRLAGKMPRMFYCTSMATNLSEGQTIYVAAVGPDTVLRTDAEQPRRLEDTPQDAIMLIELPDGPRNWMEPADVSPAEIENYFRVRNSKSPGHEHYATADGRVRPIFELNIAQLADHLTVPGE